MGVLLCKLAEIDRCASDRFKVTHKERLDAAKQAQMDYADAAMEFASQVFREALDTALLTPLSAMSADQPEFEAIERAIPSVAEQSAPIESLSWELVLPAASLNPVARQVQDPCELPQRPPKGMHRHHVGGGEVHAWAAQASVAAC